MRPIDRGAAPAAYTRYQDAGPELRKRLGDYCSYCERRIETYLAVEHVQPKVRRTELRNLWANFLLGCVNCNSSKGKKRVALRDYFWPDRDNPLRAFEYIDGGLVRPFANLARPHQTRAQDTISLTGLDKFPGNTGREPTPADQRWLRRQQTWQLASDNRSRLRSQDTALVRELIVENAIARGMFSIWWTVFADDVDIRRRLRQAFVGTHKGSFDINENLVPRAGGQL